MNDYISQQFINPRDPMVQYYRNEFGIDWESEYFAHLTRIVDQKRKVRREFFKKMLGIFTNNRSERESFNKDLVV